MKKTNIKLSTIPDIRKDDTTKAAQIIMAFGNLEKAENALQTLSKFIIYKKAS